MEEEWIDGWKNRMMDGRKRRNLDSFHHEHFLSAVLLEFLLGLPLIPLPALLWRGGEGGCSEAL